jgi:hypothetical protein
MENHLPNDNPGQINDQLININFQCEKIKINFFDKIKYYSFYKEVCYPFSLLEQKFEEAKQKYIKFRNILQEASKNLVIKNQADNVQEIAPENLERPPRELRTRFILKQIYKKNLFFIIKQGMTTFIDFIKKFKFKYFPFVSNIEELIQGNDQEDPQNNHPNLEQFKQVISNCTERMRGIQFNIIPEGRLFVFFI